MFCSMATLCKKVAFIPRTGAILAAGRLSTLDTDDGSEACHPVRESRPLAGLDHGADILVGLRGLFGHPPHGRAANQNAAPGQFIHHKAAAPALFGRMPAHGAAGAVAGGAERLRLPIICTAEDVGSTAHGAADQYRLADLPIVGG